MQKNVWNWAILISINVAFLKDVTVRYYLKVRNTRWYPYVNISQELWSERGGSAIMDGLLDVSQRLHCFINLEHHLDNEMFHFAFQNSNFFNGHAFVWLVWAASNPAGIIILFKTTSMYSRGTHLTNVFVVVYSFCIPMYSSLKLVRHRQMLFVRCVQEERFQLSMYYPLLNIQINNQIHCKILLFRNIYVT